MESNIILWQEISLIFKNPEILAINFLVISLVVIYSVLMNNLTMKTFMTRAVFVLLILGALEYMVYNRFYILEEGYPVIRLIHAGSLWVAWVIGSFLGLIFVQNIQFPKSWIYVMLYDLGFRRIASNHLARVIEQRYGKI